MLEELARIRALPSRIGRREVAADIVRRAIVPSSASVIAWRPTSASLCPASAWLCGILRPHSMTWSPSAKAWTSKPEPVRDTIVAASRASAAARSASWVIFSSMGSPATATTTRPAWRATCASSVGSCGPDQARCAATMASKRKACGVCTRASPSRETVSPSSQPSARTSVSTTGSVGTAPASILDRGEKPVDHRPGQEWTRRIMDQNGAGATGGIDRLKPGRHRLATRRAAPHDRRGNASIERRGEKRVLAIADNDEDRVDRRMRRKCIETACDHGRATDSPILFGNAAAGARAASSGDDQRDRAIWCRGTHGACA